MMRRKVKGTITVFLLGITAAVLYLAVLMIDALRMMESANYISATVSLAAVSVDNLYNREMFKDLDVVLYTMSDEAFCLKYSEILDENLKNTNAGGLDMELSSNCEMEHLLTNQLQGAEELFNRYCVNLNRKIDQEDVLICPAEYRTDAPNPMAFGLLQNEEVVGALSEHCNGRNFYQLLYEYVEEGGCIQEDLFGHRFALELPAYYGNDGRYKKADTGGALSQELKMAAYTGWWVESGSRVFKWLGDRDIDGWGRCHVHTSWEGVDAALCFAWDHYTNAATGVGKSGLKGEWEYILYGNRTDRENITKVLEEILKLRLYMNLKVLLEAGEPADDATAIRALNESFYDTLALYHGKSMPWMKGKTEYVSIGEESLEEMALLCSEAKSIDGGLTYVDYLKGQFGMSGYCDQLCCYETFYAGILDLWEYCYGIDVHNIITQADLSVRFYVSERSAKSAFSTLGKILMTNRMFGREYYIGGKV